MKVRVELDALEQLLEQSEFVRRQYEQGFAQGFAKGKVSGWQKAIIVVISQLHPELQDLAQQTVVQIHSTEKLKLLIEAITPVQNKALVHAALISALQPT